MSDPIVDEVRRVRQEYAARFGFNIRAMCRDLKEREGAGGRKVVSYPPRRVEPGRKDSK